MTAKPTIRAQHPATAAPPASPVNPRTEQMAAEEMGKVSATPTKTETRMPIRKGWSSVARMMTCPKALAAPAMGGAITQAAPMPTSVVTMGVTRISTRVSLLTALPTSEAMMATKSTARGRCRRIPPWPERRGPWAAPGGHGRWPRPWPRRS